MRPWLFILALGMVGCQTPNTAQPGTSLPGSAELTQLAFAPIEAGGMSQITQPGGQVLRSGSDWQQHVTAARGADETAPEVNFDQDMVVAVYAGEKPSGGFTIAVQKIERSAAEIVVTAKVTAPASDLGTISVLTYPYQWVKLAQSDLPVRFVIE